jgi:hypothetical protein
MTITLEGHTITMTGACGVDEVETLVAFLEDQPDRNVDLAAATAIHTAHWQALMVYRPKINGSQPSSSSVNGILSGLLVYCQGLKP